MSVPVSPRTWCHWWEFHPWGKWEEFEVTMGTQLYGIDLGGRTTRLVQVRACTRCGLRQRRPL